MNAARAATAVELRSQWRHPSDVFSVLLILGGDIVGYALAQLAGCGIAPVAFSFGWVGYSVSTLVSAVSENNLMPSQPDFRCKVLNGRTGHAIDNSSWVISRIVRDFPAGWRDRATTVKTSEVLQARWSELRHTQPDAPRPTRAGLVVTVYEPDTSRRAGIPSRDIMYWSGLLTTLLQLCIAAIPWLLQGDWGIMMITAAGIVLAFATGLLPQWRKEKWACRRNSNDTYVLTQGNGSQHAIVILGNGHGLNLEDLAAGQTNSAGRSDMATRLAVFSLAFLWTLLLITTCGLNANTWYLLAIGGVGMLQNITVAGYSRTPETFGVPLRYVAVFGRTKVMQTLFDVERDFPRLGRSLRDEFFPGGLRDGEKQAWDDLQDRAAKIEEATKDDSSSKMG